MNTKDFRAAVFGEILGWGAGAFPSLPIVTENGPVPDQDKIGSVWLDCSIRWYGSEQLTLGSAPVSGRYSGAISTQVFYRMGQGTGAVDDIIDSLEVLLRCRRLGTAHIKFPERSEPTHLNGWYKAGLFFPFKLDR